MSSDSYAIPTSLTGAFSRTPSQAPKQIEEIEVHGNMAETTAAQAGPANDTASESDLKSDSVKAASATSAQNGLDGMEPPKPPRGTPRGKITNQISGNPGGEGKPRPAPK